MGGEKTRSFRPILGYPGYHASNDGLIWSAWATRCIGHRQLEPYVSKQLRIIGGESLRAGYKRVGLRRSGRQHWFSVHALILETFVGRKPIGMEGCHENGDKFDNRVENLYWGTRQQNANDMVRAGTSAHGERNGSARLTETQVKEIVVKLNAGWSQQRVADEYKVSQVNISRIALGHIWSRVTGIQRTDK